MKVGFFCGRVGGDAELTYTQTGIAVAKFSIAIDNGKGKEGEKKNATWVKCAIWRDRAEKLAPHIKKGNMVAVTGDIEARAWIDKNTGDARCSLDCNVDKFSFAGGAKNESSSKADDAFSPAPVAQTPYPSASNSTITDEDIPF